MPEHLKSILYLSDIYLFPLYVVFLFLFVKKLIDLYYLDLSFKKYALPAFFIHVAGCLFYALVYQYFYGEGDTFGYYTGVHEIWEAFLKNPKLAFELILVNRENYSGTLKEIAPYCSYTGFAEASSAVVRIAGFTGLFCFGSYLPIALVFGTFSFWGTWLIFITINRYFPHLYKYTALACLFIPSVIIWSSGVSKEAPCMFALGLCFYSFDKLLNRISLFKHTVYIIVGATILLAIKDYIFYTFALAAFIWGFYLFLNNFKNYFVRILIKFFTVIIILGFISYFIVMPHNYFQQNLIENINKGENLQELMTLINEASGGSGYTLPPLNLNPIGIVSSLFLSLNVSLFRPYLWECKNPLMLMSFGESFFTLLLVISVLFKTGIFGIIQYCNKHSLLFFMLIFSLVMAPIVGFISFNFGTLVRYKIPFLPFFFSFLVILLFDKKMNQNKKYEG